MSDTRVTERDRTRTIAMIMAGGRGSRLAPLTSHRAKPSVPIGGRYRIIDFVLSNFVNAGYRQIYILTQYMASSLIRHINRAWHLSDPGSFVEIVPAQMRRGEQWYRGTADSVLQNFNLLEDHRAVDVAVFGGDHVYLMDVSQMQTYHRRVDAELTIAAYPVPVGEASRFGVLQVDADGRVTGFQEKVSNPKEIPGRPGWALASMGNYFFRADALRDALIADTRQHESAHDFGKDIIPRMVDRGCAVYAYDYSTNEVPGSSDQEAYWRDVGTLDSYFDAAMDMRRDFPPIDMYNRSWPVGTARRNYPPARLVRSERHDVRVIDSMICEGSIVSGCELHDVLVGYDSIVHEGARLREAVVLSGCDIGPNTRLRRVLLDKNCAVERGTVIGEDPEADRARFPFVTEGGVVVFPKGTHVPVSGPIELARDMALALELDPATASVMAEAKDKFVIGERGRHSYRSMGPRFRRFVD